MVFYEIRDQLTEIGIEDIDPGRITMGCVSNDELKICGRMLGLDEETIADSRQPNPMFRTGVDVFEKYTFAELRVVNREGSDDVVSLFIKKNLLLIVDIIDEDGSTRQKFFKALKRYPCGKINVERLIFCFIETLVAGGNLVSEEIRNRLTEMEESIVGDSCEETFNTELLELKKKILKYSNFYGQILDFTETLDDNENEILAEDNLIYITNLGSKVSRLSEDMNVLSNYADHIQDAYTGLLDQKLNSTMKVFTIITTIFFPLTIIVGWYGMNFRYMPELSWKYGYLFVTVLSVVIVGALVLIGKKKKWF